MRSRIVLAAAEGESNVAVAQRLGVTRSTVRVWRSRFAERRLDGLVDEPRPGRPRTVSDADVERLITETLEAAPRDATHWSTRSMAAHLGMSQSTVSRVWRAFGLAPHKVDTWKLSKDPLFVDKVRDDRRALPRPAGTCPGAVRRRENPDPGPGPNPAGVPDAARHARAGQPRLRPPRHLQPLRRTRRRDREGDRVAARPAPGGRVRQVPAQDRRRGAAGTGRAPGARQRLHPQDTRPSGGGWPRTRGSTCTSPRPARPG